MNNCSTIATALQTLEPSVPSRNLRVVLSSFTQAEHKLFHQFRWWNRCYRQFAAGSWPATWCEL